MPRKNHSTSHQKQTYTSGCNGKRRFANEREALAAADYQMLLKPDLELAVYQCQFCGGWHLTRSVPTDHK